MRVSPITNHYGSNNFQAAKNSFKGHWVSRVVGCLYPHEELTAGIETYVADPDESFEEIAENFAKRSGTRDFLGREYYGSSIYTVNTNYYTDLRLSREVKKLRLTESANRKFDSGDFVGAVKDKIEIANILKEQGKEKDKFLTEEGIRRIYSLADNKERFQIEKIVENYNPEMACDLFRHVK